jgi:hypothetical protein
MLKIPGVKLLDSSARELVVDVPFPFEKGVVFRLAHLSRNDGLSRIYEQCKRVEWNKEAKAQVETLDYDALATMVADAVVRGWSGLTVERLARYIALDVSEGVDLKADVPYDRETAITVLRSADKIGKWITETASDPSVFVGVRAVPRTAQSGT